MFLLWALLPGIGLQAEAIAANVEVHVSADRPVTVTLMSGTMVVDAHGLVVGKRGCLLDGVAPGRYLMIASAPGYRSAQKPAAVTEEGEAEVWLRLSKVAKEDYRKLGRVVGFVKDAQGNPVTDCLLVLYNRPRVPVGSTTPRGVTGVYELEWYPPGVYIVLVIACGVAPVDCHNIEIRAGQSTRLDPVLGQWVSERHAELTGPAQWSGPCRASCQRSSRRERHVDHGGCIGLNRHVCHCSAAAALQLR